MVPLVFFLFTLMESGRHKDRNQLSYWSNIMAKLSKERRERYALLCNIVTVLVIAWWFIAFLGLSTCIGWTLCYIVAVFFLTAASESAVPVGVDGALGRYLYIFFWYGVVTGWIWTAVFNVDIICKEVITWVKDTLMI